MASNFVYLEGTLVRYETRKVGKKETRVANLTVACYNGGQSDGPGYYDVEFWRPRPEQSKRFKEAKDNKGEKIRVAISGYLKFESWEDDKGNKRQRVKIVATALNEAFLPPDRDDGDDRNGRNNFKKRGDFKKRPQRDDEDSEEEKDEDESEEDEEDEENNKTSNKLSKKSKRSDDEEDKDDEEVPF